MFQLLAIGIDIFWTVSVGWDEDFPSSDNLQNDKETIDNVVNSINNLVKMFQFSIAIYLWFRWSTQNFDIPFFQIELRTYWQF